MALSETHAKKAGFTVAAMVAATLFAKLLGMARQILIAGIFADSVISVVSAVNDVVVRCYAGMANAACAAIDSMEFPEVVGTLAGDDTIFIIAKSEQAAKSLVRKLEQMQ